MRPRRSRSGRPLSHLAAGLTIGQAAAFADITIKTVRHYHKLGLVDEPARDSSGYRRYGSADLLRLVQVRTLAAAGVPLAEIDSLLDSDAASFAAALADVERQLTARIDELVARRATLHRLAHGDRALLSDRAVAMLEGMPSRESFRAGQGPGPGRLRRLPHRYRACPPRSPVRRPDQAHRRRRWLGPDDPHVAELATDMADHYLANPARLKIVTGLQAHTEAATRYRLIAHHGEQRESAAARLVELVETKLRSAGIHISRPDFH